MRWQPKADRVNAISECRHVRVGRHAPRESDRELKHRHDGRRSRSRDKVRGASILTRTISCTIPHAPPAARSHELRLRLIGLGTCMCMSL